MRASAQRLGKRPTLQPNTILNMGGLHSAHTRARAPLPCQLESPEGTQSPPTCTRCCASIRPLQFSFRARQSQISVTLRPILVECGPAFVETGQRWPELDRIRPSMVEFEPSLVEFGPKLVEIDQSWPKAGRSGPNHGQKRTKSGRSRPNVAQTWSEIGPDLDRHQPISGKMVDDGRPRFGRARVKFGRPSASGQCPYHALHRASGRIIAPHNA